MYSNLRALGVSGNTITSMFNSPVQSPEFFGMRARAYGLSGDMSSPKFIDDLARKFQEMSSQGPLGRMQAMGMMENLGLNNPEMIKLVNTPVQQIKEQQQWQANVDDKLGMSPAAIEKIGERLGLLLQRFEYFADAAKAKLAEGLLPTLEGALEAAANFMAKNSDKIADAIKAAMEWTYAVLPKLILNGASIALGALSALMHGIGSFFEEFAQGKGFLEGMLRPVAQFWDMVVEGLKRAYATGQAVFSALNPLDRRRVEDVYKESYDSFLPGGSDMSGRLDEIEKGGFADKVAAGFHRIGDMADSAKLQVDKTNTDLGTIEQRRNDIKNLEHLPVISKTNQQLLDETKKQNEKNSTAPSMGEFHARAYMEQMIVQGMRRARTR
jgi:hypothetical protein